MTSKRGARTVDAVWLTAAKTVFSWGVSQKHLRTNPFASVKVDVPKASVLREGGKSFNTEEARVILTASLAITNTKDAFPRAKRWVPWVCAYSGARAGEITQLRGIDITKREGFYVMRITPEAGSTKTGSARTVPLHEHLITQGFIEFVRAQGDGPLFFNVRTATDVEVDPMNPKMPPATKVRQRVGDWVRGLGISEPDGGPTHGWRHLFLKTARRAGIEPTLRFGITGHATKSEGEAYGQPEPEELAEALKKFPRYVA